MQNIGNVGRITGTFIDEITFDIGSLNYGAEDWRRDFEAMAYIGIDTLIIIRGGLEDQAVFPSRVVGNQYDPDLAKLFLDEAAKHGMKLFFGTYDSGLIYTGGLPLIENEIDLGKRFVDEVMERYGDHPALHGWYICHEAHSNKPGWNRLFRDMATYCKQATHNKPVLISPYFPGKIVGDSAYMPPEKFAASWRELLEGTTGLIDIMAFQDGTTPRNEYVSYMEQVKLLSEEFKIENWANIEAFDRHMSYNFPPRDIRVLTRRMRMAEPFVTKQITFTFSAFMSPFSTFPGAANLYRRYCEQVLGIPSPY